MTFDVLSFILGWIGCCTLIFIAEWLTDIRESDPMAHGDEAERVVRLGDQHPFAQGNGYVPTRSADFKTLHSASVSEGAKPNHG